MSRQHSSEPHSQPVAVAHAEAKLLKVVRAECPRVVERFNVVLCKRAEDGSVQANEKRRERTSLLHARVQLAKSVGRKHYGPISPHNKVVHSSVTLYEYSYYTTERYAPAMHRRHRRVRALAEVVDGVARVGVLLDSGLTSMDTWYCRSPA